MHYSLMQKVLDKIPDLAAELRQYYGEDVDIEEVVERYTQSGKLWTTDRFIIGELVLVQHLRTAKRIGCEIIVNDGDPWEVVVKRTLSNGEYILAHYSAYKGASAN